MYVVVRSTLEADAVGGLLQRVVRGLDPELPVNNVQSMDRRIGDSLISRRSPAVLAALFAAMALLLTAIGTYGVVSYAVALRRREIGLRMALGAPPATVRRQFLLVAVRLLATGTGVGLAGAWAAGRAMQALLFGVPTFDPTVVTIAAALLAVVCLAACVVPAARAARVSPVETLAEL